MAQSCERSGGSILAIADEDASRPIEFEIEVPPELEGGVYSNFFSAWHTEHEFTLDFAARQGTDVEDPLDPASPALIRCPVVARIRLPVTLAFDVIRALNKTMTDYESQFGEITRPGESG